MSNHTVQLKTSYLTACRDDWHQLFARAAHTSPFVSYEWFAALDRHLLQRSPEIIMFWRDDTLLGIAPVEVMDDTLVFIADERVTDLCDVICDREYTQEIIAALARMIIHDDLGVRLFPVEEDSPLAQLLPASVNDMKIEQGDICPFIRLSGSWDAYLGTINGKLRHELRRKLRKADATTFTSLPGKDITALFDLMAASDQSKQQFLTSEVRGFFKAIASSFEELGWLRLRGTYLSDTLISILFSFQLRETVYLYNSGFDPETAHLSPGIVSICQDIQEAIEAGINHYDFLRGDEEYKYRFGAENRNTVRLVR